MSHAKLLTAIAAGLLAAVAAAPTPAISAAARTDTDAAIELPAGFAAIWQDSQFDWDMSATAQDGLQLINGFTATGEYARISVQCAHHGMGAAQRALLERDGLLPSATAGNFRITHELAAPVPYSGEQGQLQQLAAALLPVCP